MGLEDMPYTPSLLFNQPPYTRRGPIRLPFRRVWLPGSLPVRTLRSEALQRGAAAAAAAGVQQ